MLFALLVSVIFSGTAFTIMERNKESNEKELKSAAEQFIQLVDKNDGEALKELLHPQLVQYVQLGEDLIPFKAEDFIQMVADKKLGGVERKITHKSANIVRGKTANVVVNAVSDEYDFMYQLAMVKSSDSWVIVGILVDINKLSS